MPMTVRQALKSYGIEMPEPEPQIDPRDIEEEMRAREEQNKEAFTQRVWDRFMRGE